MSGAEPAHTAQLEEIFSDSDSQAEEEEENMSQEDLEVEESFDSEDEPAQENRIGNIPLSWYDDFDHIGYNIDGQKIMRPKKMDQLDEWIEKADNPNYWRTIHDDVNGTDHILSKEEWEQLRNMVRGEIGDYDPYEDFPDFPGTLEQRIHPAKSAPEPKRRFLPSKHEHQRILKLVRHIKLGYIKFEDDKPKEKPVYDLWATEREQPLAQHIPPPKPRLPTHAASYNPPIEYLPDDEERARQEALEPQDRVYTFIPQKYDRLRNVPFYERTFVDAFERCLDLYMCPRAVRMRSERKTLQDLLPKDLPKPEELRPFPNAEGFVFRGHEGTVRSISISPDGELLASGSEDRTVRVWELQTGRCIRRYNFEHIVTKVAWNPNSRINLIAVAMHTDVIMINPMTQSEELNDQTDLLFQFTSNVEKREVAWRVPSADQKTRGYRMVVRHPVRIRSVVWHHNGDYFATVAPDGNSRAVHIHQMTRRTSQNPFRRVKERVEDAIFHPSSPYFFVATQKKVRVYDLKEQTLIKKLSSGMQWISSLDIHPGGDNLIVSSYDRRVCWFDLDLRTTPYKTLQYHRHGVRRVVFHKSLPLFASCSDDLTIHVFHSMVYNDLLQNALIVPVHVLKKHHTVSNEAGVIDIAFHPTQPWLLSAGADSEIRLFVNNP